MTEPTHTFQAWLEMGISYGFCSEPVCDTHDGVPLTPEERNEFEEGYDPCIPSVRLWNVRWTDAEGDLEPVLGDVGVVAGADVAGEAPRTPQDR
jgi:hypothetical protein